eukprot:RCo045735
MMSSSLTKWLTDRQSGRHRGQRCVPVHNPISLGLRYRYPLVGHTSCVNTIALSRGENRLLVSGSDDTTLLLWDTFRPIPQQRPLRQFRGHTGIVLCAVWGASNQHLLSCGTDETILRFDVNSSSNTFVNQFTDHSDVVQKVAFQPFSSEVFVSASADSTVKLFDCRAGTSAQGEIIGLCPFSCVAFVPTMDYTFLSCDQASGLLMWDLRRAFVPLRRGVPPSLLSAQRTRQLAVKAYHPKYRHRSGFVMSAEISGIEFSRDGSTFVCSVRKCPPLVFRTAEEMPWIEAHSATYDNKVTVKMASFLGDRDEFIGCGSDDWGVYVWALEDLQPRSEAWDGAPTSAKKAASSLALRKRRRQTEAASAEPAESAGSEIGRAS